MVDKQAASRRGSSTARRPNIADQLARTVAACLASERLLNAGTVLSAREAARAVAAVLGSRTVGEVSELVPLAISQLASELPAVRTNLTLHQYLSSGRLFAELSDAFSGAEGSDGSDLAAQVAAADRAGLDGAGLLDALTTLESHRHINLVWHQAHRYAPRLRRDPEDLFGWGWHGLKVALGRYDPTRNAFSTYACACIVSKIRDGVRAEMPIVKKMLTLRNKVNAAELTLVADLGRLPTLQEVADHLGEDVDRLKLMQVQLALADSSSLDELTHFDDDGSFTPSWLGDEGPSTEELVLRADREQRVHAALGGLDGFDARLVQLLVVEQRPLRQVCTELGLTPRQLRSHRERVFAVLASELADLAEAFDDAASPAPIGG
jgi:RNA polymerase sigma factor (sigma-70 family)